MLHTKFRGNRAMVLEKIFKRIVTNIGMVAILAM